jgi:hypothetical protein
MFAGKELNCAFCNNPGYRYEDCKKVTDIKERKIKNFNWSVVDVKIAWKMDNWRGISLPVAY